MPYSFPCLGGINGDVRVAMPEEGAGGEEEETQRELSISPETGKQSINSLLFFFRYVFGWVEMFYNFFFNHDKTSHIIQWTSKSLICE